MKIFRAILGNIVGFVSVFATYSLSFLLLTLVIYILNIIPIIKDIFNFLLQIRNDYLEGSMVFIAVVVSYYVSKIIINAINGNNKKATSISQVIIGILIELIFICSLTLNIIYGSNAFDYFSNIIWIIYGVVLISIGHSSLKDL